ncbi:MAG: hypothetical protein ACE5KM_20420, partial [Planctomycetaceae bacterium]
SVPASDRGLQIAIQPEKKTFAANGPVALQVTLKNVSKKAFRLNQPGTLGGTPKLVMANQKTAAQWSITAKARGFNPRDVVVIEPGKTVTYHVVVEGVMVFPPRPFPRPRPFPNPRPLPPRRQLKGAPAPQAAPAAGKGVALPDKRIIIGKPVRPIGRPIRPPVIIRSTLPVGQGPVKATLFLEFKQPKNAAEQKTPLWTGKLASKPVAFAIGKPTFIVPGTPVSKEQAIRVARPAAERALSAAYKPIKGLRPPKVGPWIESPEKTATAKKQKDGSWIVGWTHFPKTGHSYNVTVTVSRFGGASVREVFAGYSKAP